MSLFSQPPAEMYRIKFQFNDKNRKCSVDEIYPDRLKTPADAVGVPLIQTRPFNGIP